MDVCVCGCVRVWMCACVCASVCCLLCLFRLHSAKFETAVLVAALMPVWNMLAELPEAIPFEKPVGSLPSVPVVSQHQNFFAFLVACQSCVILTPLHSRGVLISDFAYCSCMVDSLASITCPVLCFFPGLF